MHLHLRHSESFTLAPPVDPLMVMVSLPEEPSQRMFSMFENVTPVKVLP